MERILFEHAARRLVANRNTILAIFLAAASGCASTPPPYNGLGYSEVQPMQGTGAKVAVVAPKPAQEDRPLYAPTYAPVYGYGEGYFDPGFAIPGVMGGPLVLQPQSSRGNINFTPYGSSNRARFSGRRFGGVSPY